MSRKCLDTGALIVALQEVAASSDASARARHHEHRRRLLPFLGRSFTPFIVPSTVLAEFLYGLPADYQHLAAGALGKDFHVAPFGHRAAVVAADIRTRLASGGCDEWAAFENYGTSKNVFRADLQVLAVCQAERADQLVTRDVRLRDTARRLGIKVILIDDIPFDNLIDQAGV